MKSAFDSPNHAFSSKASLKFPLLPDEFSFRIKTACSQSVNQRKVGILIYKLLCFDVDIKQDKGWDREECYTTHRSDYWNSKLQHHLLPYATYVFYLCYRLRFVSEFHLLGFDWLIWSRSILWLHSSQAAQHFQYRMKKNICKWSLNQSREISKQSATCE